VVGCLCTPLDLLGDDVVLPPADIDDLIVIFQQGAYGDTQGTEYGGWATVTKSPAETMKERAHLGSSTWIEAPSLLAEFVQGAHTGMMPPSFEREYGSEGRIHRINRANVPD